MDVRRTHLTCSLSLALLGLLGPLGDAATAGVLQPDLPVGSSAEAVAVAPAVGVADETRSGSLVVVAAQREVEAQREAQSAGAAQDLGARVDRALAGSSATTVSAAVSVDGLGSVLRKDAAHQLPPASTQKSFVSGAALLRLGKDARFVTEVAALQPPTAGVVSGDLWLVAGGDPYLTTSGLRALARSVKAAGVTRVTGVLRLDDSRYDARRNAAGWEPEWVPEESGPLSAMAVDRNGYRTDRAFLSDPAVPGAVKLRDLMRAEGISIGTVVRQRRPTGAVTIATVSSGPMSAVVRRVMKDSDNFASELVLKELGRVVSGKGTSVDGLAAVRVVLGELGVEVGAGADGSGLSSVDRQNPDSQVALLAALDASPAAAAFRTALPVACRDGTLEKRFCGTAAEGRALAKTGTLTGVRCLAGYTTTRSGRLVRFAFQLTGVTDGLRARAAIDRAVVVLASAQE